MSDIWIDVENNAGTKLGDGPIASASKWRYTSRLDKIGGFSFQMPASDPKAALLQSKRVVRAYALVGNTPTMVGAGVVDEIERQPEADGKVLLRVSGSNLLRELTYRSVLDLRLYDNGLPVTHATALAALGGYAPAGWSLIPDPAPPNPLVYARYNGDSVAAALIKIAEKCNTHFWGGADRAVTFGSAFTPSGIRAIQAHGDLTPETCAIVSLNEQTDTTDVLTRIYPRGSGNADVQLTLRATSRTAPVGYVLNKTQNYIEHTAAAAQYGRIERQLDYREIGPVANTTADIQSTANALFDAALRELQQAVQMQQASYTLSIAGCARILRPMQTIRVVYRDAMSGLGIDADLNILEATIEVNKDGVQTTGLVVSTSDRWAQTDQQAIVGSMTEGRTYQALPQLSANSYVTAYTKNVDANNIAAFRFRFGREVTQLQQASFEFQLLPFESTVTGVGLSSTTGGSGQLQTDGPSTDTSGSPSNDTSGAASGNTGAASGDTGAASGSTGNATGNTGDGGSGTTGNGGSGNTGDGGSGTTGNGGSGNTGDGGSGTTGNGGSGNTGDGGSGTTGSPSGGDTISAGRHQHTIGVTLGTSPTYPIGFGAAGTAGGLVSSVSGSTFNLPTNQQGNHVHAIGDHTHSIGNHSHSLDNHSHTLNNHSHTLNNHAHTLNSHAHTLNGHSHTLNGHSHTLNNHTHSLNAHTHSLSNHKHTFTPIVQMVYGIFRDDIANVYGVGALEYRINGGSWATLAAATAGAGGWYLLDITAALIDATTLRPVQDDNLLEIRGLTITQTINTWDAGHSAGQIEIVLVAAPDASLAVNDIIRVAGAHTSVNGLWKIDTINSGANLIVASPYGWAPTFGAAGNGGTISGPLQRKVTIDAQLAVRNVIQAIAYV